MKKIIFTAVLLAFAATITWGQSLKDNQYYRKMVELKRQSDIAFENGEYIEARRLAEEAQTYKARSDEWIETQLAAYRARSALVRVNDRLTDAARVKAEIHFPEKYSEGKRLYSEAYKQFHTGKDYVLSLETSTKALEALKGIKYVAKKVKSKNPAFYIVRLLPGNTDCFWNIAGYDFIYKDPLQWEKIYKANKDKLHQKSNPDLIHPGTVLEIPAIDGEVRSGTWDNGVIK